MTASALAAVGRTGRKAGVAFTANLFVAVVFGGQHLQGGLNDTATETVICKLLHNHYKINYRLTVGQDGG